MIEHSRLVDPKTVAHRMIAVRQDIISELIEDVLTTSFPSTAASSKSNKKLSMNPVEKPPSTPFRELNANVLGVELLYLICKILKTSVRPSKSLEHQHNMVRLQDQTIRVEEALEAGRKSRARAAYGSSLALLPMERSLFKEWLTLFKGESEAGLGMEPAPPGWIVERGYGEEGETEMPFPSDCSSDFRKLVLEVASEVRAASGTALETLAIDGPVFLAMIERLGGSAAAPLSTLASKPVNDSEINSFRLVTDMSPTQIPSEEEDDDDDDDHDWQVQITPIKDSDTLSGNKFEVILPEQSPSFTSKSLLNDSPSLIITNTTNMNNETSTNNTIDVSSIPDSPVTAGDMSSSNEEVSDETPASEGRRGWKVYGSNDATSSSDSEMNTDKETEPATDGAKMKSVKLLDPPPRAPEEPPDKYYGSIDDETGRGGPIDDNDVPRGSVDDFFRYLGPDIQIRVVDSRTDGNEFGDNDKDHEDSNDKRWLCLEAVNNKGHRVCRWVRYSEAISLLDSMNNNPTDNVTEDDSDIGTPFMGGGVPMM
eukprot:CAMPEP_0182435498 /NCGR_PEP_ID=MMETSP1167-20130531/76036_1 /TAXON_ID=2988 /ORGANISM="Mallomonas Sp, Strain CCMP3275" /LENGTH=538 /DNA_ID=CAMNT_0024626603 /DNA_START=57 /DNA_END=1673 /DNA_ORIENTATION=+